MGAGTTLVARPLLSVRLKSLRCRDESSALVGSLPLHLPPRARATAGSKAPQGPNGLAAGLGPRLRAPLVPLGGRLPSGSHLRRSRRGGAVVGSPALTVGESGVQWGPLEK